jgi:NADH dehydrogenase
MRVIVIGGGYGGIRAVQALVKNRDLEIVVIDKNGYYYLQTDVYSYIANETNISDITIDLGALFRGLREDIQYINETVLEVDENRNEVITHNSRFTYDYLIIATGSVTNMPVKVEGIHRYSYGVKSLHHALLFKQKFEASIFEYIKYGGCAKFNIIIGGGGLAGIEVAAEMAYIKDIYLTTIGSGCKGVSIYLVDGSGILKGQDPYVIEKSTKRLEKLGVKLKIGNRISKIDKDFVYFGDYDYIRYNFLIFTGGVLGNSIGLQKEVSTNKIGQYIADEYFKIHKNIFAVGDVVEVLDEKGNYVAPTAQSAEQMGTGIAKNILRDIAGKGMKKISPKNRGFLVALGGKYASANLMNLVRFSGYKAYFFKLLVTEGYKLPLKYFTAKGRKIAENW